MRVVSLINGTMISETSSIYALYYAKSFSLKLSLVHIKDNDPEVIVNKVFSDISRLASSLDIEVDLLVYESLDDLEELLMNENVDALFCSTKHNRSIFEPSFAKKIINMGMKVDLAIVKVVKQAGADSVDKIIMPIRGYQLSVRKFTFFSTLVNAYDSDAEIFSIDKVKKSQAASLNAKKVKIKLEEILFNLRHYFRLANIMKMKFSIKHHYALAEGDEVQSHIAKNSYDLAIVGGHHEKSFFTQHPIDVLFEKPMINTIYFIPTKDNV
jgi:hypothetical protein